MEVRHLRQQWASWRAGQFTSAHEAKAFGFAFFVPKLKFNISLSRNLQFSDIIKIHRHLDLALNSALRIGFVPVAQL
ncbi:Putative protein [Zobellia galactanivorans]|uniref:Uncharacterized protein n=1 Tax=Zobellia galactanivorans (strain DSM 12802 / CCUG 47099 / CIP 106680 / NCIMB 13871 / Dsij) TaxID=63186 RepID=G0L965_ZOBGA|nr:Putative protein [Zobellia galactanivorans]